MKKRQIVYAKYTTKRKSERQKVTKESTINILLIQYNEILNNPFNKYAIEKIVKNKI